MRACEEMRARWRTEAAALIFAQATPRGGEAPGATARLGHGEAGVGGVALGGLDVLRDVLRGVEDGVEGVDLIGARRGGGAAELSISAQRGGHGGAQGEERRLGASRAALEQGTSDDDK